MNKQKKIMQCHLYIYILDEISRNEMRQQCERMNHSIYDLLHLT